MEQLKYAIALTGSIGSGKSTIVGLLKHYGYESICADSIAHKVLQECASEIIACFGEEVGDGKGGIIRKNLGNVVFSSEERRKQLEEIIHPRVREQILAQARELEAQKTWYFLDIPLFFEIGGKDAYPVARTLVVYTTPKKAIERIMKRDNFTFEEAQLRLNAQMSVEEKCRLADDIIGNDGDLRSLQQRVDKYIQSL